MSQKNVITMKSLYLPVFIAVVLSSACGCWEDASQESVEKPVAVERRKGSSKRIVEPKERPATAAKEQSVAEERQAVAEGNGLQPAEVRPRAKRSKMSAEERKAAREQRREEFYRKVDAERNKTHEQRVQEHEEAMQRAQEKRDLQEARLKRILEKRAKQQQ